MTRVNDRQKAIELRRQGQTYSQIKQILGVTKSTLSEWLSKYPLTDEQIAMVKKNDTRYKDAAIEKYRNTMRLKSEARLKETYRIAKKHLLPLTQRELEIAGLFLYWGEGQKKINGAIGINNTDPTVVKFALYWLVQILKVPKSKIGVYLQLYSDMDIDNEIKYWSGALKLPKKQFRKPYIKTSTRMTLTHKGFGHGTCGLVVANILLKEKIMMGIKAIADHYSEEIESMI